MTGTGHDYHLYHPIRWNAVTPCARQLVSCARRIDMPRGLTQAGFEEFSRIFQLAFNEAIMRFDRDLRPESSRAAVREMSLATYAATFWSGHRNIYSVDPGLFEMLRHTDPGDVPIDAVNWPHRHFFVAFPPGNGMALAGEPNEIDGVYVDTRHQSLAMFVMTRRTDRHATLRNWPQVRDTYYPFMPETQGETLGAHLSSHFRAEQARLATPESVSAEDYTRIAAEYGIAIQPVTDVNNRIDATFLLDSFETAYLACAIAVNIACYLTSEPALETEYPPDTPRALLDALEAGTPRQRQNAASELVRLSILPVHRIPSPKGLVTPGADASGRSVATHWRRGHFRTVATGPGRNLRQIRWIKPTLVNPVNDTKPNRVQIHRAPAPDRNLI